jgi:hypothetical protein
VGFFRLQTWMKTQINIQLYFATILNRTCTLAGNARNSKTSNPVSQNILADIPIIVLLIYHKPELQVQPNNKVELKDQKYNTKDQYLLTPISIKRLLLLLLR